MRRFGCLAVAVALTALTAPLGASAATFPTRPFPGLRPMAAGVVVPIVTVPQPPGVGCVAVKINSGGGGAPWWGAMNCGNGLAYNIKAGPVTTVLALPPGAAKEQAFDIDQNGFTVGTASIGGVLAPEVWNPAGAPLAGPFPGCAGGPPRGIAAGIYKSGWAGAPVVGQTAMAGAPQACWWSPGGAVLIPPAPATSSFAYDVNTKPIYVGQLNGTAAAGVGPGGPLAPLGGGVAASSVAYAINTGSVIVGHEDLGGACGGVPKGAGFLIPFGGGALVVGPLGGDCTAGLEDINDNRSSTGYSAHPGLQQAIGFALLAPYPGGLFNLNTGVAPHPWVLLSDAPGIDDAGDIIATDTGVALSQVYVLI